MISFRKKTKWHKFLFSPISLLILALLSGLFIYNVVDIMKKSREATKNKKVVLIQAITLEKKEAILRSEIEHLKTDRGIEENIREKFLVVKEGEEVIIIIDDPAENQSETNSKKRSGFFQFFKSIFK